MGDVDTSTTRVMDRAHELEAHGDNGCIADAMLLRQLAASGQEEPT